MITLKYEVLHSLITEFFIFFAYMIKDVLFSGTFYSEAT